MTATTFNKWVLAQPNGFESLKLSSSSMPSNLGDYDVLVRMMAVSLNYRDILILNGKNPFPVKNDLIPGSDGAGMVVKVGARVTEFQAGDRVATMFMRDYISGPLTPVAALSALGAAVDGTITEYGTFPQHGLVHITEDMTWLEASTLPCAAVTAWTSLYGDRTLKPGDTVLTQGTGGVSLFALQLALAAGATVIATTSSIEKAEFLKKLGASHVINYKEDMTWGETARTLTKAGAGVDIVVEVGGAESLRQSLKAIRLGGIISLVGNVGSKDALEPPFHPMEIFASQATLRSIAVGNRQDFLDLLRAIQVNNIKPVIDENVFKMSQLKEAYQYMIDRQHVGKVVINMETA